MTHVPFTVVLMSMCVSGCALSAGQRSQTSADEIRTRTGATPRMNGVSAPGLPPGVTTDDGLGLEEAVATALWNNAEFQISVSTLGFARADLLEAGLLRNPVLSLLLPVGPKQLEATLRWPIEVLWERPKRVAAARVAQEAAAHRLVQAGLDLALSVKVAYADWALQLERQGSSERTAALLGRIDQLTQSRLAAGDIGELDARSARVDAARGVDDALRARRDLQIASARLRALLGFVGDGPELSRAHQAASVSSCGDLPTLLRQALTSRPDIRAAELGVETAATRLGWERSRILALGALLDANGAGREGFELGPGLEIGVPLFDRNQGGRARAAAELQRASAAYVVAQQRVSLELREASAEHEQATRSHTTWRTTIVAPLEQNVTDAGRSFEEGETSYLYVLDHTRRLLEAQWRQSEIEAEVWRARARVEHAVGRMCESAPGN